MTERENPIEGVLGISFAKKDQSHQKQSGSVQGIKPTQTDGVLIDRELEGLRSRINDIRADEYDAQARITTPTNDELPEPQKPKETKLSRVKAGIAALLIMVGGHLPMVARAESGNDSVKPSSGVVASGEMPSQELDSTSVPETTNPKNTPSTDENNEIEPSPTPNLDLKEKDIKTYEDELRNLGCPDGRLSACVNLLYSIDHNDGFLDPDFFIYPDKTVLKNYITKEQVLEFAKTGKLKEVNGNVFEPIYFKDEKGKKTDEVAIFYIANGKNPTFKVSDIEKVFSWWEKVSPGFLRTAVNNGLRIILQSQAGEDGTQLKKYGESMLFLNFSDKDPSLFRSFLSSGLSVEIFGIRGDELWGNSRIGDVAVAKQALAYECCEYIYKKTNEKYYYNLANFHLSVQNDYMKKFNLDENYVKCLIKEIKEENWMFPYGADTWAEIDSVVTA